MSENKFNELRPNQVLSILIELNKDCDPTNVRLDPKLLMDIFDEIRGLGYGILPMPK